MFKTILDCGTSCSLLYFFSAWWDTVRFQVEDGRGKQILEIRQGRYSSKPYYRIEQPVFRLAHLKLPGIMEVLLDETD